MVKGLYKKYIKRLLDISCSCSTIVALSPFLACISFVIKAEDGGPVLFCHDRVGKDGKLFRLYKFRSMPVDTRNLSSDKAQSLKITKIGEFLRRTNIDELPQLINIIKGDMSLVGPRPPIPSQVELCELRRASGVLGCVPGLTGLAQINSYDGMSVFEKVQWDKRYQADISFLKDIKIVIGTLGYLLKKPPVY
jgi:O-antigen biosynthesis protein WbqP